MLTFLLLRRIAAADGGTMAIADWHSMTITGVSRRNGRAALSQGADRRPRRRRKADEAVIKLACTAGKLIHASNIRSPARAIPRAARRPASGMHKPFTIIKEWGAASPQLSADDGRSYDVKKVEGYTAPHWRDGGLDADHAGATPMACARRCRGRSHRQDRSRTSTNN